MSGIWNKLVENVRGIGEVTRWPATTRHSRTNVILWAVSLFCAVVSITSHLLQHLYTSPVLFGVLLLTLLDVYMLATAIRGLMYRRRIDRFVKNMIEGSRHA